MSPHQDFRDLLAAFDDGEVNYLLVGGYAVAFHSRPRFTKDIDIWLDPDPGNVERAVGALAGFGAPESVLEALRRSRADEIVYLGRPPVRVDLFKSLPGVEFRACYARRVAGEWEGVPVTVIAVADLIEAKRASNRPQDRLDIETLEQGRGEW